MGGGIVTELCGVVEALAKVVEEQHKALEQLNAVAATEGYKDAKERCEALLGAWPGDTDGKE